jgi:hypothetical protein
VPDRDVLSDREAREKLTPHDRDLYQAGWVEGYRERGERARAEGEDNARLRAENERQRTALTNLARLEHVNAADSIVNAAGREAREALETAPASDEGQAS